MRSATNKQGKLKESAALLWLHFGSSLASPKTMASLEPGKTSPAQRFLFRVLSLQIGFRWSPRFLCSLGFFLVSLSQQVSLVPVFCQHLRALVGGLGVGGTFPFWFPIKHYPLWRNHPHRLLCLFPSPKSVISLLSSGWSPPLSQSNHRHSEDSAEVPGTRWAALMCGQGPPTSSTWSHAGPDFSFFFPAAKAHKAHKAHKAPLGKCSNWNAPSIHPWRLGAWEVDFVAVSCTSFPPFQGFIPFSQHGQNPRYHFGVGEFTTHFRTYLSGWIESDVHWWVSPIWFLTHGQMGHHRAAPHLQTPRIGRKLPARQLHTASTAIGKCRLDTAPWCGGGAGGFFWTKVNRASTEKNGSHQAFLGGLERRRIGLDQVFRWVYPFSRAVWFGVVWIGLSWSAARGSRFSVFRLVSLAVGLPEPRAASFPHGLRRRDTASGGALKALRRQTRPRLSLGRAKTGGLPKWAFLFASLTQNNPRGGVP